VNASDDPDLVVLQSIRDGDADSCRLLVDRHLTRLHALATRLLDSHADADEVCQDAFVRAWQQAPTWQAGNARFSTWLHQVVLNLSRDRLRSRRESMPLDAIADTADDADTPEQAHGRADRADAVRRALGQLPQRQREALVLCHFQGLSNIEAAATLELSVDALESLLARARRGLRGAIMGVPS
jgi:RNA polymerase sigma-70 factor (ECF subfamily)